MSFKIRIDKADQAFSKWVRNRDLWRCVRCQRYDPPTEHEKSSLQCSHFHGRRKESTRFAEDNCDTLCTGCHMYWGSHPEEYRAFKLKQLGEKRFNALLVLANTTQRKDRKLAFIYWNERLKQLTADKSV